MICFCALIKPDEGGAQGAVQVSGFRADQGCRVRGCGATVSHVKMITCCTHKLLPYPLAQPPCRFPQVTLLQRRLDRELVAGSRKGAPNLLIIKLWAKQALMELCTWEQVQLMARQSRRARLDQQHGDETEGSGLNEGCVAGLLCMTKSFLREWISESRDAVCVVSGSRKTLTGLPLSLRWCGPIWQTSFGAFICHCRQLGGLAPGVVAGLGGFFCSLGFVGLGDKLPASWRYYVTMTSFPQSLLPRGLSWGVCGSTNTVPSSTPNFPI